MFSCLFLSSSDFFQKKNCFNFFVRTTIRVANSLDPDQARHFVGPDLSPNCLQRLSAHDTSRQRVKTSAIRRIRLRILDNHANPKNHMFDHCMFGECKNIFC